MEREPTGVGPDDVAFRGPAAHQRCGLELVSLPVEGASAGTSERLVGHGYEGGTSCDLALLLVACP